MRIACCFIALFIVTCQAGAQSVFRTVVPPDPVEWGQPFQVQFIYQGTGTPSGLQTPAFSRVRVVAGPVVYRGQATGAKAGQQVINYVYTLEGTDPGTIWIPGAGLTVDGQTLRSPDAFVTLLPPGAKSKTGEEADDLLRPGEDPARKIKENLFLQLEVNRHRVYPGEPVLARYKLYTRLSSRSDVVKNPGFYGFALVDRVNLNDHQVLREQVRGRWYDVHVIREVQLFPLEPGQYRIDEMEVSNRVFFYRGRRGERLRTSLSEGVLDRDTGEVLPRGAEVHTVSLRTAPVTISVMPFPVSAPTGFSGAVGRFRLQARLKKDSLLRQETGWLELELSGQGNFTQVLPPAISWPAGADVFEPEIVDDLDRRRYPLEGRRLFRYRFTMTQPGTFRIPAFSFSYFNSDSGRFAALHTEPLVGKVSEQWVALPSDTPRSSGSLSAVNRRVSRIAALIVATLALLSLVYWATRRRKTADLPPVPTRIRPDVETVFAPARQALAGTDFYPVLYQCLWDWYREEWQLMGTGMDQQQLFDALQKRGLSAEYGTELRTLLQRCEWQLYTGAVVEEEAGLLLETALRLARTVPA